MISVRLMLAVNLVQFLIGMHCFILQELKRREDALSKGMFWKGRGMGFFLSGYLFVLYIW